MARYAMRTAVRAAAVSLLTNYAASTTPPLKLQVYPGRPATIYLPTAFVDGIRETITYTALNQRVPTADVIVMFGLYDSADAVAQVDAFVDGFIDWILDRYHEAGPNTGITVTEVEDLPSFVNEWVPPDRQRTYYATRIALEGLALSG